MVITTKTSVWSMEHDGNPRGPECLSKEEGIRMVAEAAGLKALVLSNNCILLLAGSKTPRVHQTGVLEEIDSMLILSENPPEMLLGTKGAHLYHWVDDGGVARPIEFFEGLECRNNWHTPWGGPPTVRSFAISKKGWVYANIHVGSIMRSPNHGHWWEPVSPALDEDVHQVATSPLAEFRVYAATASSVYISEDHGDSWLYRGAGLGGRYSRAIAVNPLDPDCILATVSDGPHGNDVHGKLYRTENAGRDWECVSQGFPSSTKNNIDTYHIGFSPEGTAWAVVDNILYRGLENASRWCEFWEAPDQISMMAL